jgi:uncharacterized protein (TIGR02466 family)
MTQDNIFPIPIITGNIGSRILDQSKIRVDTFINNTDFMNSGPRTELLTTYYSDPQKNFLGHIADNLLLEFIEQQSRQFLKTLGFDDDCFIEVSSWLQVYPPNTQFHRHEHYGALISGVIYLKTSDNCGDIVFHNPLETRRQGHGHFNVIKRTDTEYNADNITYNPENGKMIMFESWLPHSVRMNLSQEDRVCVSFNIWADKNG